MVVGWALTTHLRTELALEALEMAIWARDDRRDGLVHHSDRGSQYTAIRYTDTLAGVAAVSSVGSRGDSYDNALAESTIGQIKTDLIHRRGPWRIVAALEFALFEYLDWWNHRRLHSEIGGHPARREGSPLLRTTPDASGRRDPMNRASTEPKAVHSEHVPERWGERAGL